MPNWKTFPGRWSETRKSMAGMKIGDILDFPESEKHNAVASATRLRHMDEERRWRTQKQPNGMIRVFCEAQTEEDRTILE